jgi:hypothetical protein
VAGKDSQVMVVMLAPAIHIGVSTNGNPRYRLVTLTKGEFREYVTMSDAGFAYGINNDWAGKSTRSALLALTPAGRVRNLTYLD